MAAEKAALREELKRLKNLKRRELEEKLASLRRVAGDASLALPGGTAALEEEWDGGRHEEMMASAFGDDYYGREEDGARCRRQRIMPSSNLTPPFCSPRRGCGEAGV